MQESIELLAQYCLPQHFLSRMMGKLTESQSPQVKNWAIKRFIEKYKVNMQEAIDPNPEHYQSFNDFFTRALKSGARPIASQPNAIVSPADGKICQIGQIDEGSLLQAKGHEYTLEALLGGSSALAETFHHGHYATIYLSPKDYHRVHMPFAGTLRKMIHVPGKLFSVNPRTAARVPSLFARNERVVCLFDTALGPMVVILVGAFFVASMSTVWAGTVTPPRQKIIRQWEYNNQDIHLDRGAEMGHFKLGSTVIVLFSGENLRWMEEYKADCMIQMGEMLGVG